MAEQFAPHYRMEFNSLFKILVAFISLLSVLFVILILIKTKNNECTGVTSHLKRSTASEPYNARSEICCDRQTELAINAYSDGSYSFNSEVLLDDAFEISESSDSEADTKPSETPDPAESLSSKAILISSID